MRRTAERLAVFAVAASALLLAGCTSMFAPDPTAAPSTSPEPGTTFASVTCEPASTAFVWSADGPEVRYQAVSTRYQTYGKQPSAGGGDAVDGDYVLDSDSDQSMFAVANPDTWNPVLRNSLLASTLAPADIGTVSTVWDDTAFDPPKPHSGTWVRVVVAALESYRFTATCQDGTTGSGAFGAIVPTGATEYVIHCEGKKHPNDSARRATARAECQPHP